MSAVSYSSDIAPLKSILIHRPGNETRKVLTLASIDHPTFVSDYLSLCAREEHDHFINLLNEFGVETIELVDVLDEAIQNSRKNKKFLEWLRTEFNTRITKRIDHMNITAQSLLGGDDYFFYANSNEFDPIFDPLIFMFFTRDFACATPFGLLICNLFNETRRKETALARFIFQNSDAFQSFPIAFDATKEGVFIQGGDVIVLNERTWLIGVDNFTERDAARRIAETLDVEVIAIALPKNLAVNSTQPRRFTGLHLLFLHLDSVLTLVDNNKFLVAPYWFEKEYSKTDPLSEVLWKLNQVHPKMLEVSDFIRDIGWVTVYEPKTGREQKTKTKIVDFLSNRGLTPIFVGGERPPGYFRHKHVMETVLPELRFQAANVLAIAPGKVIAYEENVDTIQALRDADVEVHEIPGKHLVRWNGGPHCLSLPLIRKK